MRLVPVSDAPNYGGRFDGSDYIHAIDNPRLTSQLAKVYRFTSDHEWHSIPEIKAATGIAYDASVSKHLRHLRYDRFGAFLVEKRRVGDPHRGFWEYRVGAKWSGMPKKCKRDDRLRMAHQQLHEAWARGDRSVRVVLRP